MSDTVQKITIAKKEVVVGSQEHAKCLANNYFLTGVINDFGGVPTHIKLAALQKTPKNFVKERKIGSTMIPYVDYLYCQKALNFVFNFNVSNEVIGDVHFEEHTQEVSKQVWENGKQVWKKVQATVYECRLTMRFKFYDAYSDREVTRDVITGHKAFENPATSKADCIKSAVSKAWTLVAKPFGIGADIHNKEQEAYAKFGLDDAPDFTDTSDLPPDEAPKGKAKKPQKSFDPAPGNDTQSGTIEEKLAQKTMASALPTFDA